MVAWGGSPADVPYGALGRDARVWFYDVSGGAGVQLGQLAAGAGRLQRRRRHRRADSAGLGVRHVPLVPAVRRPDRRPGQAVALRGRRRPHRLVTHLRSRPLRAPTGRQPGARPQPVRGTGGPRPGGLDPDGGAAGDPRPARPDPHLPGRRRHVSPGRAGGGGVRLLRERVHSRGRVVLRNAGRIPDDPTTTFDDGVFYDLDRFFGAAPQHLPGRRPLRDPAWPPSTCPTSGWRRPPSPGSRPARPPNIQGWSYVLLADRIRAR